MRLEELKRRITSHEPDGLLRMNSDKKEYIPIRSLDGFLSPEVVEQCIIEGRVQLNRQEEAISEAVKGGKRILTILIGIDDIPTLVNFLEHDQLMDRTLDSKLPFSENDLSEILPSGMDTTRSKFFDYQWKVSVPVFKPDASHRELHPHTILPFVSSPEIGSGGSGNIFRVTLDDETQSAGSIPSSMVSDPKFVPRTVSKTNKIPGQCDCEETNTRAARFASWGRGGYPFVPPSG
jgi:hypothetical protein